MTEKIKSGVFRGDKIKYHDGIGCCIWIPFPPDDDPDLSPDPELDDCGIAFDFSYEDINDLITLLYELKKVEATNYEAEPVTIDQIIARVLAKWHNAFKALGDTFDPNEPAPMYGRSICTDPAVVAYNQQKNIQMHKVLDMMDGGKNKRKDG